MFVLGHEPVLCFCCFCFFLLCYLLIPTMLTPWLCVGVDRWVVALAVLSLFMESTPLLGLVRGGLLYGIGACVPMLIAAALLPFFAFVVVPCWLREDAFTVRDALCCCAVRRITPRICKQQPHRFRSCDVCCVCVVRVCVCRRYLTCSAIDLGAPCVSCLPWYRSFNL